MINHYVEKVKYYEGKFLESLAGILWDGKKITSLLDVMTIHEFEGAEGIVWIVAQADEIFSIFSDVTTTSEVIALVCIEDHAILI